MLDCGTVSDEEWLLQYIKSLGKLSKVVIGIGNHELVKEKSGKVYGFPEEFYQNLQKLRNVHVLDNDSFIGVTLPVDYYYHYHENTSYFIKYVNRIFPEPFLDKKYNILLCHTPIPFRNTDVFDKTMLLKTVPLILCGHMHGGMMPTILRPLAKGRGLIGPFHTVFPSLAYGKKVRDGHTIIISTGVTKVSQCHTLSRLNPLFTKEVTIIKGKKE